MGESNFENRTLLSLWSALTLPRSEALSRSTPRKALRSTRTTIAPTRWETRCPVRTWWRGTSRTGHPVTGCVVQN